MRTFCTAVSRVNGGRGGRAVMSSSRSVAASKIETLEESCPSALLRGAVYSVVPDVQRATPVHSAASHSDHASWRAHIAKVGGTHEKKYCLAGTSRSRCAVGRAGRSSGYPAGFGDGGDQSARGESLGDHQGL